MARPVMQSGRHPPRCGVACTIKWHDCAALTTCTLTQPADPLNLAR